MPPSVRTVTDLPGLGLRRVAGPEGRDRPVRWVAVSELEDPRSFLEGGELLLTTGIRLPADEPAALERYVQRLVDAGAAALGLGVGLTHETSPEGLIAAANKCGLPLIEVPDRTAFIAVSKAVSVLLGIEEYDAIRRAFEAQRDLTRAALNADPLLAVTSRLATQLKGWALLLDPSGALLQAAPTAAHSRVDGLADEVKLLRTRGLLASSSLHDSAGQISLHPLGARGKIRGFLAVGTEDPLDRTAQSVVAVAVSLLSIALEQDRSTEQARPAVAAAALRLLIAGAATSELPMDLLGWGWLTEYPLRLLTFGPDAAAGVGALEARLDPRFLVVAHDLVVVRDDSEVLRVAEESFAGMVVGGSASFDLPRLAAAAEQATAALAAARGDEIRWYGQLASSGMLSALDPAVAAGIADALLAPLRGRKGDLVSSLAAWLQRHGQWDAAAADLGVHRHTLRYRMQRVEELLNRSLDDADFRAELLLAIRIAP